MARQRNTLITASTYPRWKNDSTPDFVQQLARILQQRRGGMVVLAPHSPTAKVSENDHGIRVVRYRYFFPSVFQDIAYSGGAVYKIKKTPLYALKLIGLVASQFVYTLGLVLAKKVYVINAHWIVPQGFLAILVKMITRRKVITTVHGSDIYSLNGRIMNSIKRFTLKHSDVVCVNSVATRDACLRVFNREYEVIPMGVHMDRFFPLNVLSEKLVRKYKTTDFTILFVGRLSEVKGVEHLLKALNGLSKSGKKFNAIIAGDGPLRQSLEQYVRTNKLSSNVKFIGWISQDNLNEYYNLADVFVGPSLSEAQGLVFVEALAAGTPVVATKVGGIVDIVHDGENGLLVSPASADELETALGRLIEDRKLLRSCTASTRDSVVDRFSWDSVAGRYIKIMEAMT